MPPLSSRASRASTQMRTTNADSDSGGILQCDDESVILTDGDIKLLRAHMEPNKNLEITTKDNYIAKRIMSRYQICYIENTNFHENNEKTQCLSEDKGIRNQILKIEKDFEHWTKLRRDTISKLREVAEYIDSVSLKSGIAKAIGSGSGALAGGLTAIGGILTVASAGASLPVLIAGTSIGVAAGLGGGAAAVTETIIKSRQLKQAQASIDADKEATCHLEEDIVKLRSNKKVVNKIAKDVLLSSGSAAYDSVQIFNLVAGKAGAASSLKAGIEATAQLFGEDVGKEVSRNKVLLFR